MSDWLVYILQCEDGSYYTGATNDLFNRLKTHWTGLGSKYVRAKKPEKLVAISPVMDKSGALKLEHEIKKCKTKELKISKISASWIPFVIHDWRIKC